MVIYVLLGIVSAAALAALFLGTFWVLAQMVHRVLESTSAVVVTSVSDTMKQIFGGAEPAEQLPGNVEATEAAESYFPDIERDDLFVPGSIDEIEGIEAGWVRAKTEPPSNEE